jgi:predicted membrane protein
MCSEKQSEKEQDKVLGDEKESQAPNTTSRYPSAEFLVDACLQDYQRLQENYNKLYEKTNIVLAFVGVVLTIMLGTLDFSSFSKVTSGMKVGQLLLILIEIGCCVCGVGFLIVSAIRFLRLLKSKDVPVFNSVDIRDEKIYEETNETAAMWLIDKYTSVVFEIRPYIEKKQHIFDATLTMTIIGIVLYTISVILQKGGF